MVNLLLNKWVIGGLAVVVAVGYFGWLRHEANQKAVWKAAYLGLSENVQVTQEAYKDREKAMQEIAQQVEAKKKVIYVTKSTCGDNRPEQPVLDVMRNAPVPERP